MLLDYEISSIDNIERENKIYNSEREIHMENNDIFEPNQKIYTMINKANGATIECTEKFLPQWFARGFEVEEIKLPSSDLQ